MNKLTLLLVAMLWSLTACSGGVRENLGIKKEAPDAFKVIARPPLSVPPDFRLSPPEDLPGESLGEGEIRTLSLDDADRSRSEDAFLSKTSHIKEDPDIKRRLKLNARNEALKQEEEGFFDRLLKKSPDANESVVDPTKEKQRIVKQQRAGESITGENAQTINDTPSTLDVILDKF